MSGPASEYIPQAAMMSFKPINAIHQHLSGLHCYAYDLKNAVSAHHFCSCVRHDGDRGKIRQCIVYDSAEKDARLIGIEYVVDEEVFRNLPEDEKKYWHSHKYEVESGQLNIIAKDFVPMAAEDIAEQEAMKELHKTYGKTIHTWAIDQHPTVPLGPPSVMMAFTGPGQVDPSVISTRDAVESRSTEHKRALRAKYLDTSYEPLEGADRAMRTGKGIRLVPEDVEVERPTEADQATWKGREKLENVLKGEHEAAKCG
ncbi:hypothetical protein JCM6882_007137 [Rhodosporidiobolus microsporus]